MRTPQQILQTAGLLVLLLSVVSLSALASDCNMLLSNVDDARTKLKRAANETDLESAKDYARRAKNALEDTAISATDCECDTASSAFDTAASHARRARDADNPEEFVDSLHRAIRAFNAALDALRDCARKR